MQIYFTHVRANVGSSHSAVKAVETALGISWGAALDRIRQPRQAGRSAPVATSVGQRWSRAEAGGPELARLAAEGDENRRRYGHPGEGLAEIIERLTRANHEQQGDR